ncbi:outer membrane protein assembly factor BamB family protein [Actinoplanes siamensis]|nr:PQQ-binding-like beta-propeller repeat protein [Actinoplanes siamensis]
MGIIELGDVSAPDFPAGPDPGPAPRRHRRRLRLLAAAAAALCLAGSGRPAPPGLVESWSAATGVDDYPFPFRDAVLLNHSTPDGASAMTVLDLATGEVRWRSSDQGWLNPDPESGQLYAPRRTRTAQLPNATIMFGTDTQTFDAATGRMLWRRDGDELAATAGEVLLGDRDEQGRISALHLVRAGDGGPVWDRPIPVSPRVAVSDEPADTARIVYVTEAGELTTLRYADGARLATRRLPGPPAEPRWVPQILNGMFFDVRGGASATAVTAYRVDTLAQAWRFTTTAGDVYVQDCGPVLCVNDLYQATGVDPATGAARWRLPAADLTPLGGGRLLLTGRDQTADRTVVDASTGRVLGAAPRGSTILLVDGGGLLALRDVPGPPYLVSISRWDPVSGRTALLGAVPGRADACQPAGRRLICHVAGHLGVTDVG